MPDPAGGKISVRSLRAALGTVLRVFGAALQSFGWRVYGAALIAVIAWVTWLAIDYLVESLIARRDAPAQITGLPLRLTEETLRSRRSAFAGLGAAENPRTPPAHYHHLDGWFQPDKFNDCTRSGCHAPLPHTRRKEVRAFLNMHATSIQCGVCHMKTEGRPLDVIWYDLTTGRRREPPALLRAYGWLAGHSSPERKAALTPDDQDTIVAYLRDAAREADGEPYLQTMADHFAAVRVWSDTFRSFIDAAIDMMPRFFRGEYNAKIALRGPGGQPILRHPGTEEAVRRFLDRKGAADQAEKDKLLAPVHPRKREIAVHCGDCHRNDGGLIDFSSLGYPAARVAALSSGAVFRMIEQINAGVPMRLPEFITPGLPSPASQPAPQSQAVRQSQASR